MIQSIKYLSLILFFFFNTATAHNFSDNASGKFRRDISHSFDKTINNYHADLSSHNIHKKSIKVVAAENFYGDIAQLIAGEHADVASIITNIHSDPHLFTTSAKTAIMLQEADVIIFNGADYDLWIQPFLNIKNNDRFIIDVSTLVNTHSGDNPHLWYKPETFPMVAKKLTEVFSALKPKYKDTFQLNLKKFLQRYKSVEVLIHEIKSEFQGTKMTATEPIFRYMAEALGLTMMGQKFQWVMMNDSELTPEILIQYQELLKNNIAQVLFHNEQVKGNNVENILEIAKARNIPIISVTEIMPKEGDVVIWLNNILGQTKKALTSTKSI